MSDTNDWARRVDQITAATVHEQLRTVVRDAEDMLQRFTTTASEHGGLLLDAQRDMEATVERKIEGVSSQLVSSLDSMRREIAAIEPAAVSVDLDGLRIEVFKAIAALGEEIDGEVKKMRDEIASRVTDIGRQLAAFEDAQTKLETRVETALASVDVRLAAIVTRLDRAAGMEERAAARMVDLLASAFAELRAPSKPVLAS